MEISGPDRASVTSSMTVSVKGMSKLESAALSEADVGAKLAGCKAIGIGTLLGRVRPSMGNGISGVFVASDGISTEPIAYEDLTQGWIIHSDASGGELTQGGPLRVVFPTGVAVQSSICGNPKPVNLKGVVRLELASTFELKSAKLAEALAMSAPRLIAELEEYHTASLRAFAKHYCGVEEPASVAIAGLDARGFTLRVTSASGEVLEDLLAPFPRPLVDDRDVYPLAMEMHRAAFAALPSSFKLQSNYYTEPVSVACRLAWKSPRARLVIGSTVAAAAAVGIVLLRARR